jgi:MFS family permease
MDARSKSRFNRLWAAALVSNLGDGVAITAFPLLIASVTRDPLLVAAATVAGQLPWLLFALPAGAIVDRVDRRLAMVAADGFRAVVVAMLALFVLGGQAQLWVIYAATFALSAAETIFDPASEAILPLVVGRDALGSANARLQGTTWVLNWFVGPPLGASLFVLLAAGPFLVDAVSFVGAALIVVTLSGRYRSVPVGPRQSVRVEVREGLRWMLAHPVLRYTAPLAGLTNVALSAILGVFVLFAQDVVGVSDLGYGILMSAVGLGGLVGAATAGTIIAAVGPAGALKLSAWLAVPAAAAGGVLPIPIVVALGGFMFAWSLSLWNVAHVTLRQQLVPDELRGRVAACNRLITTGAVPFGAALGGATATAFGLRAPFLVAAVICLGVGVLAVARITPSAISAARGAAEAAPAGG